MIPRLPSAPLMTSRPKIHSGPGTHLYVEALRPSPQEKTPGMIPRLPSAPLPCLPSPPWPPVSGLRCVKKQLLHLPVAHLSFAQNMRVLPSSSHPQPCSPQPQPSPVPPLLCPPPPCLGGRASLMQTFSPRHHRDLKPAPCETHRHACSRRHRSPSF